MQNISFQHFSSLSRDLQCKILYRHGVYVGKEIKDGKTFLLYQLCGFYVEIAYQKHRNIIDNLKCTESVHVLDPYLSQVNVEELVGLYE